MSERLDLYIVTNCGVKSRERAKQLIKNGLVSVNGKVCIKPSVLVDENSGVESVSYTHLTLPTTPYV